MPGIEHEQMSGNGGGNGRGGGYAIAIHGGAGDEAAPKTEAEAEKFLEGLREALTAGLELLKAGGSSLDAVELAVCRLEDNSLFNAGRGAGYVCDGTHRLDAAVMRGSDLGVGVVAGMQKAKNPVATARRVLEAADVVFIAGEDADAFAGEQGLEQVRQSYYDTELRYKLWQEARARQTVSGSCTVGAVALDAHGGLAAAVSTGGMTNTRTGRVGDTAVIGAGIYANDKTCAVACSGTGEQFIRYTVAYDIHALVAYGGKTLDEAANTVVHGKLNPDDGGIIAVDRTGHIVITFNTEGMFRGVADHTGRFEVAT